MNLPKPDGSYSSILDEGALRTLAYVLTDFGEVISIDTETTGTDYLTCDLVGIAITHAIGRAYYIPVGDWKPETHEQLSIFQMESKNLTLDQVRHYLNPILANPNKLKVLHNAKFDLHVLRRFGFTLEEPIYDTMLATQIINNRFGEKYGLKHLTEVKLGYDMTEFKEVAGKNKFYNVPINEATQYAAADVDMTLRLREKILPYYDKFESLKPIAELEMSVIPILTDMEAHGCLVNVPYLKEVGKNLRKQLGKLTNEIYDSLNIKFNINSQAQLKEVLNKKLKLNLIKTDEPQLKTIKHPVGQLLLEYRKRMKLASTYVTGVINTLGIDGRLHTEFWQILKTGRLSSNHPNMQNLPTLKEDNPPDWPSIRRAIIVPEGYKFISIDYSQLELRIITHISQEPVWIEAFNNGEDIHAATARAIFGDVTKDGRKKAKTVNFGLLYGMSEFGLSNRLGITIEEAKDFIDNYFSILPRVQDYIALRREEVLTRKYVETPMGRRLYFRYDENDQKSREAACREGVNMPIQGAAADIVKIAMRGCYDLLKDSNYKTKMILQVHDEINFEMPIEEMDILIPQITDIMSNAYNLIVPLRVDVEFGDNWEDLEEWKKF